MKELTSTPWHIQPLRNAVRIIGGPPFYRKVAETPGGRWKDAEFIITAVNSHELLVTACKGAFRELERITGDIGFEPERYRERMAAVYALGAALKAAGVDVEGLSLAKEEA